MAIVLPVIGQSAWGPVLNAALTQLDTDIGTKVSKAGDTLTGSLNFSAALQINFGGSGSAANFTAIRASGTDALIGGRVTGDTASRFTATADGTMGWGPGGAAAQDTGLQRTAANTLSVTTANLLIGTAGRGLRVTSGANSKAGTVIANGVTPVAVATTAVTANSVVVLTFKSGTQAASTSAWVSALNAGTGFSIRSVAGDTATYNWIIFDFV